MKKNIKIGKNKKIAPGVIIGEIPSRKIKNLKLTLGNFSNLRSGSVLYLGSKIGQNLQTGHHVIIREENQIGNNFSIWSHSIIDYGCIIGNGVKVHCNCYVAQLTILEDDVFLAPGVTIANDLHPGSPDYEFCMKGPTIKKGAQIGCNVTILPHVTIGEHSLIGAGSVVTHDIPPYSIAYGNPARVRKKIKEMKCSVKDHFPYEFLFKK